MNLPSGKLMALLAVFAAIGVITGTGAFTTVSAERTATVNVEGDSSALVALGPTNGPNGVGGTGDGTTMVKSGAEPNTDATGSNGYAALTSEGVLKIDLSGAYDGGTSGAGVNKQATTDFDRVFIIKNNGANKINVSIDTLDLDSNSNTVTDSEEDDEAVDFYFYDSSGNRVSLKNANATLTPGDRVIVSIEVDTTTFSDAITSSEAKESGESTGDLMDRIEIIANQYSGSTEITPKDYS